MFTFNEIVEMEAIRRKIERLQEEITIVGSYSRFGVGANGRSGETVWRELEHVPIEIIRAVLYKRVVVKILFELDKAGHMGVNVDEERAKIKKFCEDNGIDGGAS